MEINELAQVAYGVNATNGFHNQNMSFSESRSLIVSELSECLDSHRRNNKIDWSLYNECVAKEADNKYSVSAFEKYIKGSYEEELADCYIRILDTAFNLDLTLKSIFKSKSRIDISRRIFARELIHSKNGRFSEIIDSVIYELYKSDSIENILNNTLLFIEVICKIRKIHIDRLVFLKIEYNKHRGFKHGKEY